LKRAKGRGKMNPKKKKKLTDAGEEKTKRKTQLLLGPAKQESPAQAGGKK